MKLFILSLLLAVIAMGVMGQTSQKANNKQERLCRIQKRKSPIIKHLHEKLFPTKTPQPKGHLITMEYLQDKSTVCGTIFLEKPKNYSCDGKQNIEDDCWVCPSGWNSTEM